MVRAAGRHRNAGNNSNACAAVATCDRSRLILQADKEQMFLLSSSGIRPAKGILYKLVGHLLGIWLIKDMLC